jgi:hypothetical protein
LKQFSGNRISTKQIHVQKYCFSLVCFLIPGRWIKSENPIFLKVIHHRQNSIVTTDTRSYVYMHISPFSTLIPTAGDVHQGNEGTYYI